MLEILFFCCIHLERFTCINISPSSIFYLGIWMQDVLSVSERKNEDIKENKNGTNESGEWYSFRTLLHNAYSWRILMYAKLLVPLFVSSAQGQLVYTGWYSQWWLVLWCYQLPLQFCASSLEGCWTLTNNLQSFGSILFSFVYHYLSKLWFP